jgi:CRP-like cAMP-binding protein
MNPFEALVKQVETQSLWHKTTALSRNEYLKVKGSSDTNLYFIEKGTMRIFILDELEEKTIRFGYKGEIIAALDSFISEQPSDLYIQALKATQLKVIRKSTFMNLVESNNENTKLWQTLLGALILQQMEREVDILTSSPIERYKRVQERSPRLFQEIPHKYIAAYLRMTPETLSRIKKS